MSRPIYAGLATLLLLACNAESSTEPTPNRPPVAKIGGPYEGLEGANVTFDAGSSTDADGDELSFSWRYGDGQGGSGARQSHAYRDEATYAVTLIVRDGHGGVDSTTTDVIVANVPPTITGLVIPSTAATGSPVTVQLTFTDPGTADTVTAVLDWGDGTSSPVLTLIGTHVYSSTGNYYVTATVRDNDGGVTTRRADNAINVAPPAPPPPPIVVEVVTPSRDTATSLGDSLELVFRVQGSQDYIPFTLTLSDSSVFAVFPHQAQAGYSEFVLWGRKVGQTIAKITAANVSDSVLISVTAPPPDPAASPDYEVVDLGTLGGSSAIPLAFNDRGQVVGSSLTATGERHAFLWENGAMRDLAPDFPGSQATAIGNSGVVGLAKRDPGTIGIDLFVWTNGLRTRVGGAEYAKVVTVGEGGEVVWIGFDGERDRSYIWSSGAGQPLGGLRTGPDNVSYAQAMSGGGTIVGSAMSAEYAGSQIDHAFIWQQGAMRDLGLLGEHPCDPPPEARSCSRAVAFDINTSGAIVGSSTDDSGIPHAVLWVSGAIRDLWRGRAIAINESGDILGYRNETWIEDDGGHPDDAAMFWRDGVATPLGSLGGGGTTATGLNNSSLVAGSSLTGSGIRHAFVWNSQSGMTDLGKGAVAAPAIGAQVVAINSRGDVLGFTYSVRCSFFQGLCFGPGGDPAPTRAILWRRR